jgi:DNA-directed RNA polymerase specialized sigma24 family protein
VALGRVLRKLHSCEPGRRIIGAGEGGVKIASGRRAKKGRKEDAGRRGTQLSSQHREVIDLIYYHEKTVEEVAEIIQVPKNTVKTRMFYARKSMEKLLTASGCGLH